MSADHDLPPLPDEPKPGLFRHYKGGRYEVIEVARHSETLAPMVVYRALYGERGLWVRPAEMWNEGVMVADQRVRRFSRIPDET